MNESSHNGIIPKPPPFQVFSPTESATMIKLNDNFSRLSADAQLLRDLIKVDPVIHGISPEWVIFKVVSSDFTGNPSNLRTLIAPPEPHVVIIIHNAYLHVRTPAIPPAIGTTHSYTFESIGVDIITADGLVYDNSSFPSGATGIPMVWSDPPIQAFVDANIDSSTVNAELYTDGVCYYSYLISKLDLSGREL